MNQEFHRSLLEATDQFIFSIRRDGTLCYANPVMVNTLDLHDLKQASVQSLIHPDYRTEFQSLLETSFGEVGARRVETALVLANEGLLFVAGSLARLEDDEEIVVGVFHDITDRKRAEDVLARQATHLLKASENLEKRDQEITEALEKARKYQEATDRATELAEINKDLEAEVGRRREAEETLRGLLNEKEVLLKEIHHRVKNNMQVISSLLNLQMAEIQDDSVRNLFRESQSRVRSMALIHEQLYRSKDLASVNFSDYIDNLARSIFRSYSIQAAQIRLTTEVDHLSLPLDQAIPCGLIINELICNALKYAFSGPKGHITVSLTKSDTCFQLVVADDGVGLPKDLDIDATTTLGLRLVKTLVDQIDGELVVDAAQGTRFQISFPPLNP